MIIIKQLAGSLDGLSEIDDRCFIGEDVLLRVTRSGFALEYISVPRSGWENCPRWDDGIRHGRLLAAYQDDKLIAYAAVRATPHGWGIVTDIRVDVHARRQGVATMLLDACQQYANEKGLVGLCITTTDHNPVMCHFCQHTGFQLGGIDQLALSLTPGERIKPVMRRACQLTFYRTNEKG